MRAARRGRETYSKSYEDAMRLHSEGTPITEIAKKLGVSYSAAYHWVRGLRKPEKGNINELVSALEKSGPTAAIDMKEKFPKHNELFLIAARRGLPVRRFMLKKRYGEYSVWYYLAGQEKELDLRVDALLEKVKEIKEKISTAIRD